MKLHGRSAITRLVRQGKRIHRNSELKIAARRLVWAAAAVARELMGEREQPDLNGCLLASSSSPRL